MLYNAIGFIHVLLTTMNCFLWDHKDYVLPFRQWWLKNDDHSPPLRAASAMFVVNDNCGSLLQKHHVPYNDVTSIFMDWNFYEDKPKSW